MIGDKICELRNMHHLTQKQLAEIMGLSRGAINKYETNTRTPDIETLAKLAQYFGVTLDYLCGRKATPKEKLAYRFIALFDSKGLTLNDAENKVMDDIMQIADFILDKYKNITGR